MQSTSCQLAARKTGLGTWDVVDGVRPDGQLASYQRASLRLQAQIVLTSSNDGPIGAG